MNYIELLQKYDELEASYKKLDNAYDIAFNRSNKLAMRNVILKGSLIEIGNIIGDCSGDDGDCRELLEKLELYFEENKEDVS